MELSWALAAIGFVAAIPAVLATVSTMIQYSKDRYSHLKYLAGMWASVTIWILFQAISDLIVINPELSIALHKICFYSLIGMGYFSNLFVDSLTRNSIDLKKMMLITISSTAVVIFSFLPDAMIIETGTNPLTGKLIDYPTMSGNFKTVAMVHMFLIICVALYGSLKILIYSPIMLKLYAWLNFLGNITWGILPVLIQFTHFEDIIPGIATICMGVGVLIVAIVFIREPKLAYILRFKAYRIMIQRTNTGIIVFKHDWNPLETEFSENIFSGMMSAVSTMFDQTINKGNVRGIKFDEAEITFIAGKELACILISSDSSITLRSSFDRFAKDVFRDPTIEKNVHAVNNYDNGSFLVQKHFPFISTDIRIFFDKKKKR